MLTLPDIISTAVMAAAGAFSGGVLGVIGAAAFGLNTRLPVWVGGLAGLAVALAFSVVPGQIRLRGAAGVADPSAPDLVALARYFPAEYASLVNMDREAARAGKSALDRMNLRRGVMHQMIVRQFPLQTLEVAREGEELNSAEVSKMLAVSPSACHEQLKGGGRFSFDVERVMGPELLARERAHTARVLEQTATNPAPRAASGQSPQAIFRALAMRVYHRMKPEDVEAAREGPEAGDRLWTTECRSTLLLSRAIRELPPQQYLAMVQAMGGDADRKYVTDVGD